MEFILGQGAKDVEFDDTRFVVGLRGPSLTEIESLDVRHARGGMGSAETVRNLLCESNELRRLYTGDDSWGGMISEFVMEQVAELDCDLEVFEFTDTREDFARPGACSRRGEAL